MPGDILHALIAKTYVFGSVELFGIHNYQCGYSHRLVEVLLMVPLHTVVRALLRPEIAVLFALCQLPWVFFRE